jgi:hypothetical protein
VQNKQYELSLNVFRKLEAAGVLQHLVLVGSWCLIPYRDYFRDVGTVPAVRTRDMDFLVPSVTAIRKTVDVPELLKELGFISGFRGSQGVMMLEHPELMIEFLVPERGRGSKGLQDLPKLKVNAQALRFMGIALMATVRLHFGNTLVVVPHPAAFALHKLLVAPRRRNEEKKRKDLDSAALVLDLLNKKQEMPCVRDLLAKFPPAWKKRILATMRREHFAALLKLLE